MWHANGTTGEERLGAGGEVEVPDPQHVLRCSQGLPIGTTSPRWGRPAPLFLPGRIAEPVLAPGAISDSMPEVNKAGGSRTCPERGTEAGPGS